VAETPKKDGQEDKLPVVVLQAAPGSRLTVTILSLAALAIMGAAVANSLPKSDRFALPDFEFDLSSLPKFDHLSLSNFSLPDFSLPDFSSNFSWPDFNRSRVAAQPQKTAPPPMPDPMIVEALTEIQVAQRQAATVLASLNESSAAQQAELKRLSRQVTLLSVQMDTLRGTVTLTTSSISTTSSSKPMPAFSDPTPTFSNPMITPCDPMTTCRIPASNVGGRVVRTSRRESPPIPPPLPKPVGPVSVGGAPLVPAPATGPGA
jgi:hypothetical protein